MPLGSANNILEKKYELLVTVGDTPIICCLRENAYKVCYAGCIAHPSE